VWLSSTQGAGRVEFVAAALVLLGNKRYRANRLVAGESRRSMEIPLCWGACLSWAAALGGKRKGRGGKVWEVQ
jgi:hypothetical protein